VVQGLPETASTCAGCGRVELIRGGTLAAPLCTACTRPDPSFWRCCPTCEQPQLSTRSCTRCNLRQRLQALLADRDGDIRAALRGLHDNLASSDRPNLVLAWLNKAGTAGILHQFGAGHRAISHAALDELPASKPIEHLRAILVATGALPPATSTWPGSNAGSQPHSPGATIPNSGSCSTATPSGTSCAGYGTAPAPPMPATPRQSPSNATSQPLSPCSTASGRTLADAGQQVLSGGQDSHGLACSRRSSCRRETLMSRPGWRRHRADDCGGLVVTCGAAASWRYRGRTGAGSW